MNNYQETLFSGRYSVVKVLGKGGMGTVYLAKNLKLGTLWAIKEIRKNTQNKLNFLAEPNIMKKLDHPAIVKIFDIDEDENSIYIVEEFVEGVSVEDELLKKKCIEEKTVIEWAKQICEALDYIHCVKPHPIIYRDMKPSNIMITKENKVKIIDFGIAREYKQHADSDTTYIGTRGYAAPEQYGKSQTDARTDIYSLGVTLYHMVTGMGPNDPPYEIVPIRQINPNLSEGLENIILKCTRSNPLERYQSVKELINDFNNIHKFNYAYRRKVLISRIRFFAFLIVLLSAAIIVYSVMTGYQKNKLETYNNTIKAGDEYLSQKKYDIALTTFSDAMKHIPEKVDAYRETARVYLQKCDNDQCIKYLEENVINNTKTAQDDPNIYYILGTAYFNKNDYENASAQFLKAEALDANEVMFKRDLAVSLARMGKLDEAKIKLQDIKNKNITEEVSYYVNGEILLADKKPGEAIDNFSKCLETAKDDNLKRKAFISIAQTYSSNANTLPNALDNEISVLERAQSELKEKNDIQILELLGSAHYKKSITSKDKKNELLEKSNSYFKSLVDLGYNRPYIYKNIAVIYQQLGDFTSAESALLKMKELYPEDFTCYEQLALLYADIESKRPNESRNYAKTNDNYKLAVKYAPQGEGTPELAPLVKLIDDLKKYKWIQ